MALLLAGCVGGERPRATGSFVRYEAMGRASWYGDELAGRRTASGERFAPGGLTAAHRTLPFGTLVEVTALDSGRTVTVRVNDRGPFRGDRLVDLSHGAAKLLGIDQGPPTRVRIRSVAPGERPGLVSIDKPRVTRR